jgi:cyclopropane fatty-acyl-phospholipid synthase-like methyltransferase
LALDRGPLHDRSYFDHGRPELLALIPETAERVLDIGCGAGRLGAAIKERQAATVIGIEIDESAAAIARTRIDDVVVGNVEILNPSFEPASFDCIVCGDILEHLTTDHRLLAPDNSCHISLT